MPRRGAVRYTVSAHAADSTLEPSFGVQPDGGEEHALLIQISRSARSNMQYRVPGRRQLRPGTKTKRTANAS
jgi:hypothetical protein